MMESPLLNLTHPEKEDKKRYDRSKDKGIITMMHIKIKYHKSLMVVNK